MSPLALSFLVATLALLLSGAAGISVAAWLSRTRLPGRDWLAGLVTAPMVLPPTVLGYYVLVAFGRRSVIGRAFEAMTGDPIVFSTHGAVLAATIGSLPLVILSARAALESVEVEMVQAARTLGASPLRAFFTVELPLARNGILSGLMLGFARALGDFGVTLMVAGDIPGKTQTASLAIYDAVQADRGGDALFMIVVLTAVAVVVLYAAGRLARAHGGR